MDNDFNAQFDAMALPLLRGAGLVSDAVFNAIPCTVLIDRSVTYQNADTGALSRFTTLTAFRAEIGVSDPPLKSVFVVGALEYVVDKITDADESRVVMLVTPRPALPVVPFNLITEDGDQLVTEDSDHLVTES